MGEGARPATAEDLERVAQLVAEALRIPAEEAAGFVADHDGPGALFVGTYDGAVVGVAAARPPAGRVAVARLDLCYVEPAGRGVGVGEALIEGVAAWAASLGAGELEAVAEPGDRATKRLFEATGFKTRRLVLRRRVDGRPAAR